jgi:hypothetical protein
MASPKPIKTFCDQNMSSSADALAEIGIAVEQTTVAQDSQPVVEKPVRRRKVFA